MKCPNCGVELLSTMTRCPRCKYDLNEGKVTYTERDRLNQEIVEKEKKVYEAIEKEKQDAEERLANFLYTNSESFEGYRIVEYKNAMSTLVSEFLECYNETTKLIVFSLSNNNLFRDQVLRMEQACFNSLRKEAVKRGGNAIICMRFDISSIGQFVFVSGQGTAVKIEKIEN